MKIVARIAAALRRACAILSQVAWVPIRMADGTIDWIRRLVAPPMPFAAPEVQEAVDEVRETDQLDGDLEGYITVGRLVQRAAQERLREGLVVSGDIPAGIRNWVETLSRDELHVLAGQEPEFIGMHLDGKCVMTDQLGLAISRPDEIADSERVERRREERRRRERSYAYAAERRRLRDATPALVPGF